MDITVINDFILDMDYDINTIYIYLNTVKKSTQTNMAI